MYKENLIQIFINFVISQHKDKLQLYFNTKIQLIRGSNKKLTMKKCKIKMPTFYKKADHYKQKYNEVENFHFRILFLYLFFN
jgi:hypothetical protein